MMQHEQRVVCGPPAVLGFASLTAPGGVRPSVDGGWGMSGSSVKAERRRAEAHAAAQERALAYVSESRLAYIRALEQYEGAVEHADALGCGGSAIGRAAGLSEGAIRGFLQRRRKVS